MMRRGSAVVTCLATLLGGLQAAAELNIGDPAPPLKIKEWVRGDAVNLAKDAAKKIHMIEFWATWCPPCKASVPLLTQYQKKHDKDLVIVGVTDPDPRNSPTDIKQFVKEQGANMSYTVAMDDGGSTTQAYMPSEVAGIPYAFLVGRDGKVVWHGSPLDPALEKVLPDVIGGSYDVAAAKAAASVEQEVAKRFQTLEMAFQLGQREAVWEGVVDILRIDPANETAMQVLTSLYVDDPKRGDVFRKTIRDHIGKHKGNARAMQSVARTLCENDDLSTRTPDLAIEAGRAAYEAAGQRDRRTIETYAQALYQIGDLDRAIALQKDAVAAAPETDREISQRVLEHYQLCKKLQSAN